MKRAKIYALVAVLALAAMLLTSCGLFGKGEIKLKKILDGDATAEHALVPTVAVRMDDLAGATLKDSDGELYYFEKVSGSRIYHKVLHLETGNTVLELTSDSVVAYEVSIGSVSYGNYSGNTEGYIRVVKSADGLATTYLYGDAGNLIAEASGREPVSQHADLLRFGGAFYQVSEGRIAKLCDWSPMVKWPAPDLHIGDLYYEIEDSGDGLHVTVYDDELAVLSVYKTPSYAEEVVYTVLGGGDILLQYLVRLPEGSEEYTALIEEGRELVPVDMVTAIVDCKDGEASEIDCEYRFAIAAFLSEDAVAALGLDADRCAGFALAMEIENGRIPAFDFEDCRYLILDEDGDVRTIRDFMGARVMSVLLVTDGRWCVKTEDGRVYLVDEDADLIGEMTNAEPVGDRYLECDERIYDMELRELLDYGEMELVPVETLAGEGTLYFKNKSGELLLWSGSGEPSAVLSEGSAVVSYTVHTWGYSVPDPANGRTVAYGAGGAELFSVDSLSPSFTFLGESDSAALISAKNARGTTVYYRLSK